MSRYLLDVNLLLAMAWPKHVHHAEATGWIEKNYQAGWATCPITQCGFVRISSNPRFSPDAVSPQRAVAMLRETIAVRHHGFWEDDLNMGESDFLQSGLVVRHDQVTDAYLLGLAIRKGGKLATLDRKMKALLPNNSPHAGVLVLVPV